MSTRQDWSDALLDARREVGDPEADAVVAKIRETGRGGAYAIGLLLRDLVDNDDVPAHSLPPAVRDYFEDTALAPWADPAKMELASAIFLRNAGLFPLVLHSAALPYCYAARKGVQVLARTGRLESSAQRRVVETAQFILDVMSPGGLAFDEARVGYGVRSAQKVRLMHAAIRGLLREDPTWDPRWGAPINQEDLAGTLLSFSIISLQALERLGVDFSADEREAYVHHWNVIGRLLGVDEDLLAGDYAAGVRLAATIARRQHAPCPEGPMMTRALLEYVDYTIPGSALDGLLALLIHEHAGREVAEILGVPRPALDRRWLVALGAYGGAQDGLGDRSPLFRHLSIAYGRLLLGGLLLAYRGPKREPFRIPSALRSVS
ncbi:MAG: oxygenase MpaB family protein [Nannocystaceae bacterium]